MSVIKSNELNNKIVRDDADYSDEVKIDITIFQKKVEKTYKQELIFYKQ